MQKTIFPGFIWLLLLYSLFGWQSLQAQVNVNVSVAPPYPVHLEDILKFEGQVVLTVSNLSATPVPVKLLATIEGDNGVKISTRPDFIPSTPLLLTAGQTSVLTGAQLRNLNKNLREQDLNISGISVGQLIQTEQLPEGVYTICVRAYHYQTGSPLSPDMMGCTPISVTLYDPPFLNLPQDQSHVQPQTPTFLAFSWLPTGLTGKTRYRFELVDMSLNQLANPNDAFLLPGLLPYYKQENILTNTLVYDMSKPALIKGRRYAWRVTAYDPTQSISFKNGGKSEVWSFTYGQTQVEGPQGLSNGPTGGGPGNPVGSFGDLQNPVTPQMNYAPPCSPLVCSPAPVQGPAVSSGIGPGSKVMLGYFELEIVSMQWAGSKINGTGRIYVPMFKGRIAVDIKNLEVNAQSKAISGTATALYDVNSNVGEACKSFANGMEGVTPEMIKSLHAQVENAKKYVKDSLGVDAKLPFGMKTEKMQQLQLINISAIEFKADGARFNAFMSVDIPEEENSSLGFGAKGICFHPTGLSGQTIEELHLVGDQLVMPFGDKITLKIKGTGTQGGTYIKWDCEGYEEMQVEGEFEFDSDLLKPLKKDQDKVRARFALNAAVWGDLMGAVDLDSFYVSGIKNLDFHFQEVTLDFSDFKNPNGMKFPGNYTGTKDKSWRGFYFKQIKATLPGYLKKANKSIDLTMNDCIINKQGFTGKVTLEPFFGINDGKVGKWAFSIDKISIALVNNSLNASSFDGKIRVPISETGIGYHCALSSVGETLKTEFGIHNVDSLDVKMWIARMNLMPGSSISVEATGSEVICKTDFTGNITVQGEFKDIPSLDLQVPDVKFSHLVVSNAAPFLACQEFALASPQKSLNGFNISFNPAKAPAEFKDMVGAKLYAANDTCNLSFGFMVSLHEGNNGISGFSNLTIHSKLKQENGGMQWLYEKTRLNSIAVDATMAVVRIKGKVEFFYGDDKKYGKGFRGKFSVTFKPTFSADATVQFGKVNGYKYWYVDANIKFTPGIAVGPAFALYGFGGGAYYHMSPEKSSFPKADVFKQEGDSLPVKPFSVQAMGETDSGVKYVPDQGTAFGFKASVVIGTFPSPRPFNADVALEAKIGTEGSLDMIKLVVDAYFMCDVLDRKNPKVHGNGTIEYKETGGQRYFDANFSLDILIKAGNVTALKGGGSLNVHVESAGMEGEGGKWWVLLGKPDPGARVMISIMNTVEMGGYVMLGNQIPGPPPLPPDFMDKLPNFKHSRVVNGDVSGFGFGLDFKFDRNFKFLIFYADLKMQLGFDVFVIDAKGLSCPDNPHPGVNGFYATGQMYAGFDAAVGLDINVWFLKAKFEVFHAYIYAGLAAGLPNPTWVMGEVAGGFEIFNGLAKGEFHLHFKVGEICDQGASSPFGGLTIIGDIAPKSDKSSIFSVPEVAFNADLGKEVSVKTYSEDGEKIYYYRFHLESISVKRTAAMKNGKMTPLPNPGNYAGKATLVKARLAQYESDLALEPSSTYEVTARVSGERLDDGKWVIIMDSTGKKKYFEEKKRTFTTDVAPNKFTNDNIAYTYPHRKQRYFYGDDVSGGLIQFEKDIESLFNVKPYSNAFVYKYVAKFTRIENGLHVAAETPLQYDAAEKRVYFDVPNLMKEKVYMVQFLAKLEKNPSQWLAANTTSSIITKTTNDSYKQDSSYLNTSKQTTEIQGTTVLVGTNEHELYRYFFRTSKYGSIHSKWDDYKKESQDIGSDDYERRLTGVYKGKEAWGKYDLRPYPYVIGSQNKQEIAPLLNPSLPAWYINPPNITGDAAGQAYDHFYKHVRKFLFGGNAPCTEDALVYDWPNIMANCAPRVQPQATEYSGNSTALAAHSFSHLESAVLAVGFKYQGDGPAELSMEEVTQAYGNGGNNGGSNIQHFSVQGGSGPLQGGLSLQAAPVAGDHALKITWDFVHMSYHAREDFADFLASHGNMGSCENGFRDYFFDYSDPDDYTLKFKKTGKQYKFKINYQAPPGAKGKSLNFNEGVLSY